MAYIRVKVLLETHQLPGCHQHIVIKNNFDTCTFLLLNLYAHHNRMLGIPPTYIYRPTLCCTATYTRCQAGHLLSLTHTTSSNLYIFTAKFTTVFTSSYSPHSASCLPEVITRTCSQTPLLSSPSQQCLPSGGHHTPQVNKWLYAALLSDRPLDHTKHAMTAIQNKWDISINQWYIRALFYPCIQAI